jgi:hypothetical protein
MIASALFSLIGVGFAGAMLIIAALTIRRGDLDRIDRRADDTRREISEKTSELERKVVALETKLADCELGRQELRAENLTLLQRLVAVEVKINGGSKKRRKT